MIVIRALCVALGLVLVWRASTALEANKGLEEAPVVTLKAIDRLKSADGPRWMEIEEGVLLYSAALSGRGETGAHDVLVPLVSRYQALRHGEGKIVTARLLVRLRSLDVTSDDRQSSLIDGERTRVIRPPADSLSAIATDRVKGVLLANAGQAPPEYRRLYRRRGVILRDDIRVLMPPPRPWTSDTASGALFAGVLLGLFGLVGAGKFGPAADVQASDREARVEAGASLSTP